MQGISASFVDQQQNEWARFEVDHLHMTQSAIGTLHVSVIKAEGFKSSDTFGHNDHYVVLSIMSEQWESQVITGESPVWKSEELANMHAHDAPGCDFDCSMAARFTDSMNVTLWDYDYASKDDQLGSVDINIKYEVLKERDLGRPCRSFIRWYDVGPFDTTSGKPAGRVQLCIKWDKESDLTPVMLEFNMGRCVLAAMEQEFKRSTGLMETMGKARGLTGDVIQGVLRGVAAVATVGLSETRREDAFGLHAISDKLGLVGDDAGEPKRRVRGKHPIPTKTVFAIDHGIHFIQKWTAPDKQVVKALLLEFVDVTCAEHTEGDVGAVSINIDDSFVRGAIDFAASLIGSDVTDPRTGIGTGRHEANLALAFVSGQDDHVNEQVFHEGSTTHCEKPGVMRIAGFTMLLGLSIDNFVARLDVDKNARKLAMAGGVDLVALLHGPMYKTAMTIVRQLVDFELSIDFTELALPRQDLILTQLDQANEITSYITVRFPNS